MDESGGRVTAPTFGSAREAHAAGWFSRRHQTRGPHEAAREARQARLDAKMARARAQNERTATRKALAKPKAAA